MQEKMLRPSIVLFLLVFSSSAFSNGWTCSRANMLSDPSMLVMAKSLNQELKKAGHHVNDGLMYDVVKEVLPETLEKFDRRFAAAYHELFSSLSKRYRGRTLELMQKLFSDNHGCEFQNALLATNGLPEDVQSSLKTARSQSEAEDIVVSYLHSQGYFSKADARLLVRESHSFIALISETVAPVQTEMMLDFMNAFRQPDRYASVKRMYKALGK